MGRILYTAFLGAVAGLVAWLTMEPFAPRSFFDAGWPAWTLKFTLLVGGLVAGVLGAAYGHSLGGPKRALKMGVVGLIAGGLLGVIGVHVGGALAFGIAPDLGTTRSVLGVFARMIQLGVLGAAIGLAVGVPARSWKQSVLGLIGGAVAGTACGVVFNPISDLLGPITNGVKGGDEIGIPGRAVTSVLLGAAIGLCVALVRQIAKTAWVRLNLGRNEFREWPIDHAQTFIGRSESAHIPLYGDATIAPMHACILVQQGAYYLADGGTPAGTRLNGQPVQTAPLFNGAQIGIGSYTLEFLMRPGSAAARAAERIHAQNAPIAIVTQPPMGPALVVLNGPLAGQRFPMMAMEIGRESPVIRLSTDTLASRHHARIEPVGPGWQIVDLQSTNGTLVNGSRCAQALLRPGDVITVGATQFRFESQ